MGENDEDKYFTMRQLWYDEDEYNLFYKKGIELYGLNELDELLDEINQHSVLTGHWIRRLRTIFYRGKKLKEAEATVTKIYMLFKHLDFDNIDIIESEETAKYAEKIVLIAKKLHNSTLGILMMFFSATMMISTSPLFLLFWIFIFGRNVKIVIGNYKEKKRISRWHKALIEHLKKSQIAFGEVDKIVHQIEKKLTPYIKEAISITPLAKTADYIWSSKFGGIPYWRKDKEYPVNAKGNKLYMIAQLNFKEIPHIQDFPTEGILQFFIADNDMWGLDLDGDFETIFTNQQGYRVIYHEKIIEDESLLEKELPIVNKQTNMPLEKEYALEFKKTNEFPALQDCMFEIVAGDIYEYNDDVNDKINQKIYSDGNKLGGYATFTQEDPRYGVCKEWQLLFQMDSNYDEDIEIMWGDSGVANFFIEPALLKAGDFSRVWYNWDCY